MRRGREWAKLGVAMLVVSAMLASSPGIAMAGISSLGFLTQGYDAGNNEIYYYTVGSYDFIFTSANPWGIDRFTAMHGYSFEQKGDFGTLWSYQFFDANQKNNSFGGHDFVPPSQAKTIIQANRANPAWVQAMMAQHHGIVRLRDNFGPVDSESGSFDFWANGYLMPWTGHHDAKRTITDAGFDNQDQITGRWYHQYYDHAAWTSAKPPTVRATITAPNGKFEPGQDFAVSAKFTSPEDAHNQVPSGYPSGHRYYAALFDASGNHIKPLRIGGGGFPMYGLDLTKVPNGSYDESRVQPQALTTVHNGGTATSGTDTFTIPASDTAGLEKGTYYAVIYIFDELRRYGYQKVPLVLGGGAAPTTGDGMSGTDLTPNPTAVIAADSRGAEQFDVLDGIPTSESLYVNAKTKNYLYDYQYTQMKGEKIYNITFTKTYTWSVDSYDETGAWIGSTPGSYEDSQTIPVTREYSYWVLKKLEVYGIQNAVVQNFALPNERVTLTPQDGYRVPAVQSKHSDAEEDHLIEPEPPEVVPLGTEDLGSGDSAPAIPTEDYTGQAEDLVEEIRVKNDRFSFNGTVLMSDAETEKDGPTPSGIPAAEEIGEDVLFGENYVIHPQKSNYDSAPSDGTVTYAPVPGVLGSPSPKTYPIPGINPVTVHTPVVNYSYTSDDYRYNQMTQPDRSRMTFILDRPFTVTMPTTGQHLAIKGYGNRDYAKYTKSRQVSFPFDVWIGGENSSRYIQANRWIEIPAGQQSLGFFLPVWIEEGDYTVSFREIAINSPESGFGWQMTANTDLSNYVATHTVPVKVIGRVYDFHVTDIADYNWQSVFRLGDGITPTGLYYEAGTRGIDGAPNGNEEPYMLPVLIGRHPGAGQKNLAVKTGYHFKFDLKTKGNMFGPEDGIQIKPTFEFVYKDGRGRQDVDLYYVRSSDQKFVRIGSADDQEKRYVILNEPMRNVPAVELTDTAKYWPNGAQAYFQEAGKRTYVGFWDLMILTQRVRTFIGPKQIPAGVDADRALVAEQRWYGQYSLPAAPYIVPQGTDLAAYGRTHGGLDRQSDVFLKNGYIIVKFNIETIRNKDTDHPYLQYIYAPLNNQWRMEGFTPGYTDPYGRFFATEDGDVMFYDADRSSRDDFDSNQTH